MNAFPPELSTPPLPLVALLGVPPAADAVVSHLRTGRRPPLTSVVAVDAGAAARLFPARKPAAADPDAVAGVFKAEWYGKHRTRRPAVAALLVARGDVASGAAAWASTAAALDAVKTAAGRRGTRVVIGVVDGGSASPPPPLPDDRAAAVARAAGVPPSCVVVFDPAEPGDAGVRRLGDALYGAACAHYKADADRRRAAATARDSARGGPPPPAAAARLHLKLGALAEFRGDWRAAVTAYVAAHAHLVAAVAGGLDGDAPAPSPQRADELASVAEIAHFKAATLLLHQRRGGDAAALFAAHVRAFGGAPRAAPPGATARAAAFTARQHAIMADLVAFRDDGTQPAPPDAARVRLLVDAARAAVAARRAAEKARMTATQPPPSIVPGAYVGQCVVPGPPPRRLTEAEHEAHLASTADADAAPALAALAAARAAATAAGATSVRESASLAALEGRERVAAGDVGGREDLVAAASVYRSERWHGPLARVLLDARDAATAAAPPDLASAVATGLEAASLEGGLPQAKRRDLQTAALRAAADNMAAPLDLPVDSATGLASAFGLWASADGRAAPAAACTGSPGARASFVGAVWSHLPADLPIVGATLEVVDGAGVCWVEARGVASVDEGVAAAEPSSSALTPTTPITLAPASWTRLAASWTPRAPGAAHVAALRLWLTPSVCLTWRASDAAPPGDPGDTQSAVASRVPPFLGRPPPPLTRPPWHRAALSTTGWAVDVAPAGGRPRVSLRAPAVVLAGEHAPLVVAIAAAAAPLRGGSVTLTASDGGDVVGSGGTVLPPNTPIPLPDTPAGGTACVDASVSWRGVGRCTLTATLTHTEAGAGVAPSHDVLTAALDVAPALDVERVEGCGPPGYAALHAVASDADTAPPPTPSSPAPLPDPPLPTGQDCVLTVTLAARAGLEVTALDLETAPGVRRCNGDAVAVPVRLTSGDAVTALFRVRRDEPSEAASPGVLNVTWRRSGPVKLVVVAGDAGGGETTRDAVPSPTTTTTSLPLPALSFARPFLSAHADWPPRAVAGAPLPLTLTLAARAGTPGARVAVAVADGHGFVIDGRRRAWVEVLPGRTVIETLTLVPHAAGALTLPSVTLTLEGGGATLDATAGGVVVVEPC